MNILSSFNDICLYIGRGHPQLMEFILWQRLSTHEGFRVHTPNTNLVEANSVLVVFWQATRQTLWRVNVSKNIINRVVIM